MNKSKIIRKVKKIFMGPRVTKEGNSKFWGTKDLHEECLAELNQMTTEQKLWFLLQQGVIEVEDYQP